MPIPGFDSNLVLPPHLGNPTTRAELSPYPCTTIELCQQLGSTPERRAILKGFLQFRHLLLQAGIVNGFHWLDGSFLEQVETREGRAPKDMDIVTFYWLMPGQNLNQQIVPNLVDRAAVKQTYHLDHFFVDIAHHPLLTVEETRYWVGLFSHRRDGIWKGMLRVELNTPAEDADAKMIVEQQP